MVETTLETINSRITHRLKEKGLQSILALYLSGKFNLTQIKFLLLRLALRDSKF